MSNSKIRGKPDVSNFQKNRNPDNFLKGGQEGSEGKFEVYEKKQKNSATIQKLFRFPPELATALRDDSADRSRIENRRVTETEILIEILTSHYKTRK
ncbi:hypothetical protein [Nitrosomonas mobilis]|jgi:hypothetical protein|uniref:Uncharacterized protein n=1 Tax=Nitrosomonas mobilis TaxID=51642 RepID=A0A1G5SDW0_9PROT|nr:hypothetical protein [Nitrosomonas mobilis]SCZ85040.1 conserved hypothetical protein [Nitrosomonas mobilis]HNO75909.1 hypothetical protein [Nitrosomonas mobilis]